MIFITSYRVKPHMSKEETAEMMAVFAEHGSSPGEIAHYVAVDGSHGMVISDSDDLGATYRNVLRFSQWIEFDSSVMLPVADAVPHILDALS